MNQTPTNSTGALLLTRRRSLALSGLSLSAGAVALLGGREALAAGAPASAEQMATDLRILNTALGAEWEAIAAYQVGAESGLLQPDVRKLALGFQSHHKEHADAIAATVRKLGGQAVSAKTQYSFPTDKLKSQADVLQFAAELEKGAEPPYLGAVQLCTDRPLAQVAASILGDVPAPSAIWLQALGQTPAPSAFTA